ncbi:hypothetical protein [Arthrobacter sp. CG_A4]|uniref:hypothetical protein n=1 Tax=Arthrobacter sp. CG_A4 TaxID=3071706 RepID=UPI002E044E87|nr:FtsZ-interacting cell division protein ZipA [Arthrobacter sp. CG_A4]
MDSGQLIGIIVGVVVVLAIVAVAVMFGRRRKMAEDRNRAVEMREHARADELGAKEREAKAARAEADAKQAEVDAERLREEARARQEEADRGHAGAHEQLQKADELDPDVVTGEHGDTRAPEDAPPEGSGGEELRRDRSTRNPVTGDPAPNSGDNQPRGDHPRNL